MREAARLELVRLAEAGELRVTVERTYPLTDAAAALRDSKAGGTRGKLIVVP